MDCYIGLENAKLFCQGRWSEVKSGGTFLSATRRAIRLGKNSEIHATPYAPTTFTWFKSCHPRKNT